MYACALAKRSDLGILYSNVESFAAVASGASRKGGNENGAFSSFSPFLPRE